MWTQIGLKITGETTRDEFGENVSTNAAGDIIAVSSRKTDYIKIYKLDPWDGVSWNQLGDTFYDVEAYNTSLNSAGDIIAFGGVGTPTKIYKWNGAFWEKLGSDIDNVAYDERGEYGYSVSLNSAGDIIAIGAPYNSNNKVGGGLVRVYKWNGNDWIKLGLDISGKFDGESSGYSINLNASGNRLAIGSPNYDKRNATSTFTDIGLTRIYEWDGTRWTQMGLDITGYSFTDFSSSGWVVMLNAVGDRVAVAAYQSSPDRYNLYVGETKIFQWDGRFWNQIGNSILGKTINDECGISMSLNAAGDTVAVGAIFARKYGVNKPEEITRGYVSVYKLNGNFWNQLGSDIEGENEDKSGFSVSLNAAGDRVVIGAPYNENRKGCIRAYNFIPTTTTIRPTTTTTTTTTRRPRPRPTTTTTTTLPPNVTTTTTRPPSPSNSVDVYFDVLDYKNENNLSSYSLNITPLTFIPQIKNIENSKVLWNFGDGTISDAITATKSYNYPGKYYVNLVVYDCFNNAKISTYTAEIMIYDYLPHNFIIDTVGQTSQINIYSSKISGPWRIIATYPTYQNKTNIFYEVEGSKSVYHQNQRNNKYGHLENTYGLYDKFLNKKLNSYQFREINSIEIPNNEVYLKKSDKSIVVCQKTDEGSEFAGISGYKDIYFKDDTISNQDIIKFYFDKTNIYSPTSSNHVSYFNTTSVLLSSKVVENTLSARFSMTSNGLDGEYYSISSFDINPIQFESNLLYFTIKLKDNENFSVKTYPISSLLNNSPYGIYVVDSNLETVTENISAVKHYLGASRCYLNLSDLYINKDQVNGPYSIILRHDFTLQTAGSSTPFYVYPKDYYKISKKHEDFNMGDVLKNLRFQETLVDKNVLFDDFLGAIYNQTNPIDDNLGAKLYEKISNFVENTQDVDRNEISALISQFEMLDGDILKNVSNYPESIKRILNLISISKNKLNGYENKFSDNFDIKGYSSKDTYGRNIGNQISTLNYTITAGFDIVALEKFSNNYKRLNTYIPLSAETISLINDTYTLSSYNETWGWPLVLPAGFNPVDFDKYYTFFEYVSTYDGTITDNTIDFNNSMCTVPQSASYTDLYKKDGIFDHMLRYKLNSKLGTNFTIPLSSLGRLGIVDPLVLDLQFAQDKSLSARKGPTPTFSRTQTSTISGSTYIGADGLIKYAASDEPRFDHDLDMLDCRGLLIEPTRANLLLQSHNFPSSWTTTSSTVSSNVETSPDGSGNADKLITNSGVTQGRVTQAFTLTGPYVYSVFAKAGEWSWLCLYPISGAGGVWFNLSTGQVGAQSSGFVGYMTSFGNGWWRCSVSFTGVGTVATTARIIATNSNGPAFSFTTGDGTSGIFIWGAQLEAGSFPTSYIPTTTGSVTRGTDICVISGADFSTIYNSGEGTLVVNAAANVLSGNDIYFPSIYNSTTPVIGSYFRSDQQYRLTSNVSSVLLTPDTNYNTEGVFYSVAIAADRNGADYVINGNQIADSYTGSTYLADSLQMALSGSTVINEVKYYRKRLSVDQQIDLTT